MAISPPAVAMLAGLPGKLTIRQSERIHPGTAQREADALAAAGSKVLLVAANPAAGIDFMDPEELAPAVADGAARAEAQIEQLAAVWND